MTDFRVLITTSSTDRIKRNMGEVMRAHKILTPTMLGMAIGAVALGGTAVAASNAVLLGAANKTNSVTGIKNSDGTALKLDSPSTAPPLTVTSAKQVPNLNASLLGGSPASAFLKAGSVRQGHITQIVADVTGFSGEATCPAGSVPTGGGGLPDVTTATSFLPTLVASTFAFDDVTNEPNGWFVAFDGDSTYDGSGFVTVTCTDLPQVGSAPSTPRRAAGSVEHSLAHQARR